MSKKTEATMRAMPSAGPDFQHLLDQEVVIVDDTSLAATGAVSVQPDHSPRKRASHAQGAPVRFVPLSGIADLALVHEVQRLLWTQAEYLDAKQWEDFIDMFADDGMYWMPSTPEQADWQSQPSIFAEDKLLMEIRKDRLNHPNAWSQAPLWRTNHIIGHIDIESATERQVLVRSRFHVMELRRDAVRHFGGHTQHRLVRSDSGMLKIQHQRVDLFNAQAPFDYVLQAWV